MQCEHKTKVLLDKQNTFVVLPLQQTQRWSLQRNFFTGIENKTHLIELSIKRNIFSPYSVF